MIIDKHARANEKKMIAHLSLPEEKED